MTVVRTLVPTTFANAAQGVLTHPNPLPAGVGTFLFKMQQDNSTGLWLLDGSQGIQAAMQYAADGVNFVQLGSVETIIDEAFPAYGVIPAGEYRWGVDIPDVGLTTRKVRVGYRFLKSLRISGTIEVL